MAKKLTCTAPDGSIVSRRTDRTYSHVVLVRLSEAVARRNAEKWARYDTDTNYDWYVRNGKTTLDRDAFHEQKRADELASVENLAAKGRYTEWGAYAWCGREDLARKQADKARAQGDYYSDIAIVPVNP